MTVTEQDERSGSGARPEPWFGRAIAAVAFIPVFFVLAFALGYPLYDLMGYKPENDDAPLWVDVICTIPILAVSLIPCAAAIYLGRRAVNGGDRRGLIPLGVGVLAALGLTVLSVVTLMA